MTLRGSGTEFHDTTISVNGTEQKTFGQDTDSAYDVTATVDQTKTTTVKFSPYTRFGEGSIDREVWSFTAPPDTVEMDVTVDNTADQDSFNSSFLCELFMGGEKVDTVDSGVNGTQTFTLFASTSDRTATFEIVDLFETIIRDISTTIEMTRPINPDPTVESVIKTE